jgi:hypothetical protein
MNGTQSQKTKKRAEPMDPAAMYENLKSRIAALEEEEVHGEEEQKKIGMSSPQVAAYVRLISTTSSRRCSQINQGCLGVCDPD